MFNKCIHQWEVLDKTILESAWEQITKRSHIESLTKASPDMFTKKVIITLTCKQCGELKIHSEENP